MSKTVELRGLSKSLTVAGTAERLSANPLLSGDVAIQSDLSNRGLIVIGGSDVLMSSKNGIVIQPGETITLNDLFPKVDVFFDLNNVWFDGEITGNSLSMLYAR